jgi:SOS-response transcriptional repressor LexA
MATQEIIEWVQEVLRAKDWSQAELNRRLDEQLGRAHQDRSIINKVLKGRRGLEANELLAIEQVSGIPAPREGDLVPPIAVPVISWVSATKLTLNDPVENIEDAPKIVMPGLDPKGDWIALRVDGDSMNKISPPDSIIFVNRKDKRLVPNALYVIATDEGEATYKRYRDGKFSPVSTNKSHKSLKLKPGHSPKIIGRVRRSLLSM